MGGLICCMAKQIASASSNANERRQTSSRQIPANHPPSPYCHCLQCLYVFQSYHVAQQIELQEQENKVIAKAGGSVAGSIMGSVVG